MKYSKIVLISLICLLPISFYSCRTSQTHKQQKEIEKRKKERKKETELQYQQAVKRHHDIQSKDTKKRIKQTQKKAEKLNNPKRKNSFFSRWFKKDKCLD